MANIIELIAKLKDEASGGLEKLGTSLRKVADVGLEPIARISPTAASALGGLLDKAGPTGLAVAAIGGAAIGAVAGITHLVKGVADVGDRLHDMETRTGASVEALQSLGLAAEKSGGSLEDVVQSFRFLQQAITQAGEGNEQAIQGFEKLGLNLGELKRLSPEEQFSTLAKAINDIPDPAARATAAVDVFGRAGAQLLPTLREVAERGLGDLVESAKRLGIVMSSETAAKADEFNEKLTDIHKVAQGLAIELGTSLLPTFVELAKGVAAATLAVSQFLRESGGVSKGIRDITESAISTIPVFGEMLKFGKLGQEVFLGIGPAAASAAEGIKKTGDAAAKAGDNLLQLSQKEKAAFESIAAAATKAAKDRETAEITASGNVLAQIAKDLDQQKAAITATAAKQIETINAVEKRGIDASSERAQAERTQLDAIVAAEIDAANKRKAAIAGFVSEALGFIKTLGPGLEDVQRKLEIADTLNKASQALLALGQSAGAAGLTSKDLADTVSKVRDQLTALGATGAQIGAAVPENIKAIADSFDRVANRAEVVDGVFTNVVADVGRLTGAVAELDRQLTGESLDDSFVEVAATADQSTQSFGEYGDALLEVIQHTHDMDLETKIWGRDAEAAEESTQSLTSAANEGPSRFAKFADSLKQAAIGAQGLASASHVASGAMTEMGNIGAGVAAIIAAMNPFFSGRTTDEILAQRVKFVKELSQVLADAQGRVETLKGSIAGGGGGGLGTASLAAPLVKGAERLEEAGERVGDDIIRAARALSGKPFGFFQHGGIVEGPPGRHIPILAEPGELVIPRRITDQLLSRRGRVFQQGGLVTASSGAAPVNITIHVGAGSIETERHAQTLAREIHRRIRDDLRRGVLLT